MCYALWRCVCSPLKCRKCNVCAIAKNRPIVRLIESFESRLNLRLEEVCSASAKWRRGLKQTSWHKTDIIICLLKIIMLSRHTSKLLRHSYSRAISNCRGFASANVETGIFIFVSYGVQSRVQFLSFHCHRTAKLIETCWNIAVV